MTDALPISPASIAEWLPFAKAAGFFLATFILEDVAAIGAGLLLATGGISWPAAFMACFLGIWMGDVGLYALARYAGRSWFERSSLRHFAAKVAQSERWFEKLGTPIIVFSRMVPGARLPTYLAAGFLRVPLPRFLLITGIASCLWTVLVLFLAERFGTQVTAWLGTYKHAGLMLAGVGAGALLLVQFVRRLFREFEWRRVAAWCVRWTRWEFWPAWLFYLPVAVHGVWLMIKYRGVTTPTASNPGIFSGGMVGESKIRTLEELSATSPEFTAVAALVAGGPTEERLRSLQTARDRLQIDFPFILKPDLGQRGVGVKLIKTAEQAEGYLRQTSAPLIVQRYAPGPHEVGVFYYRFPHEQRGQIFAITEKVFPEVTGDGCSTINELIWRDPRARLVAGKYLRRFESRRNEILAAGARLKLVEAGNHAQGCIFRDGMRFSTPELAARIDDISQRLDGFFVGRFDIRYANEADLRAGKNFQIIELNGAASEATSIYDSRNSLFAAYRTLFRQWEIVFAIGAANRRRGCATTRIPAFLKKWREYSKIAATYPAAD